MVSYLEKVQELMGQCDAATITQVPRNENSNVDALAHLTIALEDSLLKTIPLDFLEEPSTNKSQQVNKITSKPSWIDPIIAYLRNGVLLEDKFEACRL